MTRVGLCLGAGGLMGQAFHAGVLAALCVDLGWDARDADLVVGTSAGAVTGAMLRLGTSPVDLASWSLGHAPGDADDLLDGLAAVREVLPGLGPGDLLRPWRLPALRTWFPTGPRPWSLRPAAVVSSMLPNGRTALEDLLARHLDGSIGDAVPEGLWICAVRRSDGRRVTFGGPADEPVPLGSAIAASVCVPGYFAPVTIGGQRYLDGGIHSPTNADLLASEHLDLVIVVSPMTGGDGPVERVVRRFARRRLRAEVDQLERAGTRVVVFEPGPASARVLRVNPAATDGVDRVLRGAFFEAGAQVADPEVRRLLRQLDVAR